MFHIILLCRHVNLCVVSCLYSIWQLHCISKGNHQALSIECFCFYLNKAITITSNDQDTTTDFVPTTATVAYALNSSPIDRTDITRSITAPSRDLKFLHNFKLQPTPALTQSQMTAIYNYLSKTASNAAFAREVLKLLLEEWCTTHWEHANTGCNQVIFKEGDMGSVCIQVQSNPSKR